MLTQEDKEYLANKMEVEGFDYLFTDYSDWEEIKDAKFHKYLKAYKKAASNLQRYISIDGET